MTKEEAKRNQEKIAKYYNLGWWYGTNCNKCCGVYPKLIAHLEGFNDLCRYECEVCGTTTEAQEMPWQAEKEWNEGRFIAKQISLF